MEFELKSLSSAAIPAALERAKGYRMLNEPAQAESICLDILQIEPDNQQAIITLLLSLADQFSESIIDNLDRAWSLLPSIDDEYQRAYYNGLLYERQARIYMRRGTPGSSYAAYDLFREAMRCYEKAEEMNPSGNDEALLRWNTCARAIMSARLQPQPLDDYSPMLE
jgi:tetratricopeptide (TPR) repeat protein